MDTNRWMLLNDIEDRNKLPESDSEDDSDNSLENETSNQNPRLLQEVENRIRLYGHIPCTFNYKLMKTLASRLKDHMDLLTELHVCDHAKFHDDIDFEVSRPDNVEKYISKLHAGLVLICRKDEQKITWGKILPALLKIERSDVLSALFAPELDEYWKCLLNCRVKLAPEHTSNPKQPVESLECDSRLEMFGIPQNRSTNGASTSAMQDSGINSSCQEQEQAISSSLSNMTINNDRRSVAPDPNANGMPQLIPPAVAQNQFGFTPSYYQWLQMGMMGQHPPSLPTQAGMQYVNPFMANSAMMSQQQNVFPGNPSLTYMFARPPNMETKANSMSFQSAAMPISFSSAYSTLPIASGSIPSNFCSPGVVNNEMQMSNGNFAQRNERNNYASERIPRGVSTSEPVDEMDNLKIHVLLTYSRDAEEVAKELQLRLWEEFSILAMTAQEMRERMKHSPGEDVAIRCREVKYVVPLLSKKYIADIGYGHLLDNEYVSSLYDCDENKDDRNLVSSIYTQFVNMCFTEGGRNLKVRPVSVIANSFAIRQQLTPCLINAWHLWRDFENFVSVIIAGLDF